MADKEKNNASDIYDSEGYRKDITPEQKKTISKLLEKEKSLKPISEDEINHFRKVLFKKLKPEIAEKIKFAIMTGEGGIISFKPITQNQETELFYYYLSKFLKDYQEIKTLIFWEELGQRLTNNKFTKKAYASMKADIETEIKNTKGEEQPAEELIIENGNFFLIPNSPALNSLATIRTRQFLPAQLDLYGNAEIQEGENFKLTIKNYLDLPNGLPATSLQLLDCFLIIFTKNPLKEAKIQLSLKEYMEMRGLSDPKSARQQVLKDMEVLSKISYQAKEKIKGKWVESGDISIFGGTKIIKNGIIYFNFNVDFRNALINYSISDYSKEALKIDPKRKPHAYYFLKYIDTNYRLNEGKDRLNISLGTLIRKSPQLPTYEEVMKGNKNIYKRIIKCTIDNLDSIDCLYFDILDPEGNIVEDPYTFFKGSGGYELFIHSSLKIDYSDYPTHPERVKKRKKYSSKSEKK